MSKQDEITQRVLIGRNLCKAREMAGYTQSFVMQEVLGACDPRQKNRISEIENGKLMPDAEILAGLCKLYQVSSDWVLGFTIEPVLDETVRQASMLYGSLTETMGEVLQSISAQLALVGTRQITSLPIASSIELFELAKKISSTLNLGAVAKSPAEKELVMNFLSVVREYDKKLAIKYRDMEIALDDVANRDEAERRQLIAQDLVNSQLIRFPTARKDNKVKTKDYGMDDLFGGFSGMES